MLIGLTGRAGSGKDTVCERARAIWGDELVGRLSFADILYESAASSLGVTTDDLRAWKNDDATTVEVRSHNLVQKVLSIREYLQAYGTEAHRDIFGPNFWVDHLTIPHHGGRLVFVTDVRFPNEAYHVVENGPGIIVRVVGPNDEEAPLHVSESGVPPGYISHSIDNTTRDDGYRYLDTQLRDLVFTYMPGVGS